MLGRQMLPRRGALLADKPDAATTASGLSAQYVKRLTHHWHQLDLSWMEQVALAWKKPITEIKDYLGEGQTQMMVLS